MSRFGASLVGPPKIGRFGAKRVDEAEIMPPPADDPAPAGDSSGFFGRAGDLIKTALGPAAGPTQPRGSDPEYEAARDRTRETVQPAFDAAARGVDSNVATRAFSRSGLQFGALAQNVVLRPLQFFGNEAAGEQADATNRVLAEIAAGDREKTARGWIAQNLGEGVARGVDTITESLGSAVLGGAVGKAAGAANAGLALYFGGTAADQALTEAKDLGLSGAQAGAYAAGVGGLEAALMLAGGAVAKKFGLETAEEALLSETRPVITNLLRRSGASAAFKGLGKGVAGGAIEGGEEALTTLGQEMWKAALEGDAAGAAKRVAAKLRDPELWKAVGESAVVGGASRGAFGAANQIARGVRAAAEKLPAAMKQIATRVEGRQAAAQFIKQAEPAPAVEQSTDPGVGAPSPQSPALATAEDRAAFERIAARSAWVEDAIGARGTNRALEFLGNATPDALAKLRQPLSQKQFAEITGLKKTSQTFRTAFQSTIELYHNIDHRPGAAGGGVETPPGNELVGIAPGGVQQSTATPPPAAPTVAQDATQAAPVASESTSPVDAATAPTEAQPALPGQTDTAAKREFVDRDREMLGLPAVPDAESRPWAEALGDAQTAGIPARAVDLASAVLESPRALSDVETAGLVLRAAELKNEFDARLGALVPLADPAEISTRAAELNRLETEFDTITRAMRTSGTEKGRALAAQKLTVDENYDLLSVLTRTKAAKGAPLTLAERTKIEALTARAKRKRRLLDRADTNIRRQAKAQDHREVTRLRGAIAQIRKAIGLDAAKPGSVDVPGLTDEDRAALADLRPKLAAAEAAITKLDELPPADRVHDRPSQREVSDLDDAIARARAAMRRKARFADSAADEQRHIEALEKRLAAAEDTLRKAVAGEPIDRQHQRRADVMSEARDKLHYELQKTRQDIRDAINEAKPKNIWNKAQSVSDVSLGLMTSLDYSAMLRQGKFMLWSSVTKPHIVANAAADMFKAGWSPQKAWEAEDAIRNRPNAPHYDLGLHIDYSDTPLTKREESIASKLLESVPLVAGSQRAYRAALNRMRADAFDAEAATLVNPTRADYKALGHAVNVFTGRGGLKAAEKHMRTAGLVLWSPRKLLGNIQFELGDPYFRATPEVKKIVARMYLRSAVGAAMWYAMYGAFLRDDPRFSVTLDPRSADFGKIVVGNTRFDPLAGLAQITRFAGRLFSSKTVDQYGRVKQLTARDKENEIKRFIRGKLNPIVGHAVNIATGEDINRQPYNLSSLEGVQNVALAPFTPLPLSSFADPIKDLGIPRGLAANILAAFGEGVQVYD